MYANFIIIKTCIEVNVKGKDMGFAILTNLHITHSVCKAKGIMKNEINHRVGTSCFRHTSCKLTIVEINPIVEKKPRLQLTLNHTTGNLFDDE